MADDLDNLLERASRSIDESADMAALDAVRVAYLGKKGELTAQLKNLGQLPAEERPAAGQAINEIKVKIQGLLEARRDALNDVAIATKLAEETVDITLPGRAADAGGLHPVTLTMNRISQMFSKLGFDIAEGPEVEDEAELAEHPVDAVHRQRNRVQPAAAAAPAGQRDIQLFTGEFRRDRGVAEFGLACLQQHLDLGLDAVDRLPRRRALVRRQLAEALQPRGQFAFFAEVSHAHGIERGQVLRLANRLGGLRQQIF